MPKRDTIVIGASAGGVQALSELVAALPADLPAAVFIVLHIPSNAPSLLPDILSRNASLPVAHAVNGEKIQTGKVYVARADHHLMIEDCHIKLVHGPKENLHRPSIDALFRSAARWRGPRVIGVVLTGARADGTVGMRAIKECGGLTIVQDPSEAQFPSMPLSVIHEIKTDYSLPVREIGPLLAKLSHESTEEEGRYTVPEDIDLEVKIAQQQIESAELIATVEKLGKISKLTCPDCQGALWEIKDHDILRYRCHVGHAYSAESLGEGQIQALEFALWSAVRALEEQMILSRRIVERARNANQMRAVRIFEKRAQEAETHSSILRELLLRTERNDLAEPVSSS